MSCWRISLADANNILATVIVDQFWHGKHSRVPKTPLTPILVFSIVKCTRLTDVGSVFCHGYTNTIISTPASPNMYISIITSNTRAWVGLAWNLAPGFSSNCMIFLTGAVCQSQESPYPRNAGASSNVVTLA